MEKFSHIFQILTIVNSIHIINCRENIIHLNLLKEVIVYKNIVVFYASFKLMVKFIM